MIVPLVNEVMKKRSAKQVGEFLGNVLDDTLARRSGMTIDVVAAWEEIAGPDIAPFTLPEKIHWPRQAEPDQPYPPATLQLACDGHRALFIQHAMSGLIQRINLYFGYHAVDRIKLIQKPIVAAQQRTKRKENRLTDDEEARLKAVLDQIDDENLRARVERFGRGVIAKNRDAAS